MVQADDIVKISAYFSKIHHTAGRLRVKIDKNITQEVKNISLEQITSLPNDIAGLQEIKINKIMATATILYDPSIFKPQLWDDLMSGKNLEKITQILNELQSQIKEVK
jgi:hypothetical protein